MSGPGLAPAGARRAAQADQAARRRDDEPPRPLSRERIADYLIGRGYRFVVDDDGDLTGTWDGSRFWFLLLGEQQEILQVRGRWHRTLQLDQRDAAALAVNDWNRERIWPKAYLREEEGVLALYSEVSADFEPGVTEPTAGPAAGVRPGHRGADVLRARGAAAPRRRVAAGRAGQLTAPPVVAGRASRTHTRDRTVRGCPGGTDMSDTSSRRPTRATGARAHQGHDLRDLQRTARRDVPVRPRPVGGGHRPADDRRGPGRGRSTRAGSSPPTCSRSRW